MYQSIVQIQNQNSTLASLDSFLLVGLVFELWSSIKVAFFLRRFCDCPNANLFFGLLFLRFNFVLWNGMSINLKRLVVKFYKICQYLLQIITAAIELDEYIRTITKISRGHAGTLSTAFACDRKSFHTKFFVCHSQYCLNIHNYQNEERWRFYRNMIKLNKL
jgi:hypothetical protein